MSDPKHEIPEEDVQILHGTNQPMTAQELVAYRKLLSFLANTDERSLAFFILQAFEFRAAQQRQDLSVHVETKLDFLQFCTRALSAAGAPGKREREIYEAFNFADARHWFDYVVDEVGDTIFPQIFFDPKFKVSAVGRKFLTSATNELPQRNALEIPSRQNQEPNKPTAGLEEKHSEAQSAKKSAPTNLASKSTKNIDPDFDSWPNTEGKLAIHKYFLSELKRLYPICGFDFFKAGDFNLDGYRREDLTDWLKAMASFDRLISNEKSGSARKYKINGSSQK